MGFLKFTRKKDRSTTLGSPTTNVLIIAIAPTTREDNYRTAKYRENYSEMASNTSDRL